MCNNGAIPLAMRRHIIVVVVVVFVVVVVVVIVFIVVVVEILRQDVYVIATVTVCGGNPPGSVLYLCTTSW